MKKKNDLMHPKYMIVCVFWKAGWKKEASWGVRKKEGMFFENDLSYQIKNKNLDER